MAIITKIYHGYTIKYRSQHKASSMRWVAGIIDRIGAFEIRYSGKTFEELKKQIGDSKYNYK